MSLSDPPAPIADTDNLDADLGEAGFVKPEFFGHARRHIKNPPFDKWPAVIDTNNGRVLWAAEFDQAY